MNTKPRRAPLFLLTLLAGLLAGTTAYSQVAVPTTPRSFKTRGVGDATNTANVNVTPAPTPPTVIRSVTYYSVSQPRQWTSTDGKTLVGKLILFEEHVAETLKGSNNAPAPAPTALPASPTVVRDGKARLLINNRPFELPLDRLSKPDQDFIATVKNGLAKTTPAP